MMSTPERQAYSDDRDFVNPYHERELTQDEFAALLRSRFATVALFAQRAVAGSRIEALGGARGGGHRVRIERADGEWRVAGPPAPLYLVAVASTPSCPSCPASRACSTTGSRCSPSAQATARRRMLQELRERREELVAALRARAARGGRGAARAGVGRVAAARARPPASSTASSARTRRSPAACAAPMHRVFRALR